MGLRFVPFAQPKHMLGCGRDMADGTRFGAFCITVVDCSLHPGLQVSRLLFWQLGFEDSVRVPVQPCEQVLVMWSACKSVGALLVCLLGQVMFNLQPLICDVHLSCKHEVCGRPGPVEQVMNVPSPLKEVCYRGCHGTFDCIPRVLLGL